MRPCEPAQSWSAGYWEARYAAGGHSGAGSRGRLAAYKAAFLDAFVQANRVTGVIDLGCGDGALLSLIAPPAYVGLDVSPTTLARCAARFAARPECRFLPYDNVDAVEPADLTLSLDVIYHLVEDVAFADYMGRLFALSTRFVIVYASNCDASWPSPHVRHRRFTDAAPSDWHLAAHLPSPYRFDPTRPDDTSFADFFVYARPGTGCVVTCPPTDSSRSSTRAQCSSSP